MYSVTHPKADEIAVAVTQAIQPYTSLAGPHAHACACRAFACLMRTWHMTLMQSLPVSGLRIGMNATPA